MTRLASGSLARFKLMILSYQSGLSERPQDRRHQKPLRQCTANVAVGSICTEIQWPCYVRSSPLRRFLLAAARGDEDERIVRYVASLDEASIRGLLRYETTSGKPFEQKRCDILAHLFNHQTHHRGQAHTVISICTGREPPSLDLLAMQRGLPAPDLRSIASRVSAG
jgi:hypothetical protein